MKFAGYSCRVCCCALVAALAVTISTTAAAEDSHHTCACEANELGFTIDCSTAGHQAQLDALGVLQAKGCDKDCSSDECHKNFLIVQSHHDFCLHGDVPELSEDSFHIYEGKCEECSIIKKRDPALVDCPPAKCDDSGNAAFQGLLANNCLTDCSTDVCAGFYQVLRVEHDRCGHDTLSQVSENGLHEYEEPCEAVSCNALSTEADVDAQLVCESSAFMPWWVGKLSVLTVATLLVVY
jgi:hypothetical protein